MPDGQGRVIGGDEPVAQLVTRPYMDYVAPPGLECRIPAQLFLLLSDSQSFDL